MKKTSILLIFLIVFSTGYSLKLIYDLQNRVINNDLIIRNNSDLIAKLDVLTQEIYEEQIKRTKHVYVVPYLKGLIEPHQAPLSGIVLCDKNGRISGITPGARALLGLEEDMGDAPESIFEVIPVEHQQNHKDYLAKETIPHSPTVKTTVKIRDKRVEISAQYLTTEKTYIVYLKESL
jgi:PAS domain-containing protein